MLHVAMHDIQLSSSSSFKEEKKATILTALYFCVFTFSHSYSLLYFCCFLSLWTDRWDEQQSDLWPLSSNLGSSAGQLRVSKRVDLTWTLTVPVGQCQLLFDCNRTQRAWEEKKEEGTKLNILVQQKQLTLYLINKNIIWLLLMIY